MEEEEEEEEEEKGSGVPLLVPCHRVVPSRGPTGSYMGGRGNHLKEWLLAHERRGGEGSR
ncbi:hypothetical protein CRUP_013844 [Coryphaenoides rupestris]|nr:hypothetical protein CRUP_013844 [Coryphaenoides rupestris]